MCVCQNYASLLTLTFPLCHSSTEESQRPKPQLRFLRTIVLLEEFTKVGMPLESIVALRPILSSASN